MYKLTKEQKLANLEETIAAKKAKLERLKKEVQTLEELLQKRRKSN